MSLIESLRIPLSEKLKINTFLLDIIFIVFGSLLITLCSKISIFLPFTPVPITFQTFAILLIGMLMGSKRGSITVLFYLSQGIIGIPVFAGSIAGIGYLLGPTGGYLIGFVPAAFIVGFLAEKKFDRKLYLCALALLIGNITLHICGLLWLSRFLGFNGILEKAFYPFIIGDLCKIALAIWILPVGWRLINKFK